MADAPFTGCRQIQIADEAKGIKFPAHVLYPTDTPSAPTAFGPYSVHVAMDAAPLAGRYPLVVISHGNSGWHLAYLKDDALQHVTVPILMFIGERDQITPRWHAEVVLNGVPDRSKVQLEVVENGGHFSFLSPFPLTMRRPDFAPATDPEGFDRERFHQHLPAAVQAFLDDTLKQKPS